MVDTLLDSFRPIMMGGILLVIGLGQVDRRLGAALGLAFWAFMAWLGHERYARGGAIGIGTFAFPEMVFYTVCAFLVAVNLFGLRASMLRDAHLRRRRALEEAEED